MRLEGSIKDKDENFNRLLEEKDRHYQQLVAEIEKNRDESLKTLKEQFEKSSSDLEMKMQAATEKMLKEREAQFAASSGEKLGRILEPLNSSLKAMQEKVNENTHTNTELGGKLAESIKNLLDHTESAQASADKLASMLRGNSKHQGEWGERILKEILESLNLKEGIHFDVQQTFTSANGLAMKNEDGRMGRPDVILHLDKEKDVIIDSKVSLSAYLQYQEAKSEEELEDALKKHVASIEKHVAELVKKDYTGYVSKDRIRLGYVIMFVPNTSALLLATKAKPTLWREAMEKNIYIADEQTLYAALKIVSLTWYQIKQNANHTEVFELAEEMIQRVANFIKPFNEIGAKLADAASSFNTAKKKLEEGGQSIPQTCRKLIKLGAKSPKPQKGVDATLFLPDEET